MGSGLCSGLRLVHACVARKGALRVEVTVVMGSQEGIT